MSTKPVLPDTSFAELAVELAIIARDKAMAANAAEIMVATIETNGQKDIGATIKHNGLRSSVVMLKRRALLAGKAADTMLALASREHEIRAMMRGEVPVTSR